MRAAFELKCSKRAETFDRTDRVRESTSVARFDFKQFEAPTSPRGIRAIHVKQFASPQRRFISANTHADFKHETRDACVVTSDQRFADVAGKRACARGEHWSFFTRESNEFSIAGCLHFREIAQALRRAQQFTQRFKRASEQHAAARKCS